MRWCNLFRYRFRLHGHLRLQMMTYCFHPRLRSRLYHQASFYTYFVNIVNVILITIVIYRIFAEYDVIVATV